MIVFGTKTKQEKNVYEKREKAVQYEKKDESIEYEKKEENTRPRQANRYQKDNNKRNTSRPKKVPVLKNQDYVLKNEVTPKQAEPKNARERRREEERSEGDPNSNSNPPGSGK